MWSAYPNALYSIHGINMPSFSWYGIHMPLFPYGYAITMGCYGLSIVPKGRYCDVPIIWPLMFHEIREAVGETPDNALTTRMHGDYRVSIVRFFVVFNAICETFLWNNRIYIEGRNCMLSTVPGLLKNARAPLDILSSWWIGWRRHACMGKPF